MPAEVDLTDFPFMPVLIARLKQSRAWLLCKRKPELAFYMLNLWTASWHARPAASLENDDDVLADLAMCQLTTWKRVKADVLRGWVGCSDGRLYHPVVAEQALSAWERKSAQRARTEAARLARVGKRKSQSDVAATTQPVVTTTETVTGHATEPVTEPVTESVTVSVTELVTENVTSSKGQGQGQGQGQGHIESSASPRPLAAAEPVPKDDSPTRAVPEPSPTAAAEAMLGADPLDTTAARPSVHAGLEQRCRLAVGAEPCLCDPNFAPILAVLDEPGITEADVLAGIAQALAKAGKRFAYWGSFSGWIRGAAKDRLGAKPRIVTASGSGGAKVATTYVPGIGDVPTLAMTTGITRWKRGGAWNPAWNFPPDDERCAIPAALLGPVETIAGTRRWAVVVERVMALWRRDAVWPGSGWGPPPSDPDCAVPERFHRVLEEV